MLIINLRIWRLSVLFSWIIRLFEGTVPLSVSFLFTLLTSMLVNRGKNHSSSIVVIVGPWVYLLDNPFSVLKFFQNAQQNVGAQKGEKSSILICFFNKSLSSGKSALTKWTDKVMLASEFLRQGCYLFISSKRIWKSAIDLFLFYLQKCIKA